jgi:hypothetical protein
MKKTEIKEPKSLLEVREWKQKVSDEMTRLGMAKYHLKSKLRTDAIIKSVCSKTLSPALHPVERKLSKV